jgi:uncharacterized membrane protein YqaE (UPF0057 family)
MCIRMLIIRTIDELYVDFRRLPPVRVWNGRMCTRMLIICTIDELCVDFRRLPPVGVWTGDGYENVDYSYN